MDEENLFKILILYFFFFFFLKAFQVSLGSACSKVWLLSENQVVENSWIVLEFGERFFFFKEFMGTGH